MCLQGQEYFIPKFSSKGFDPNINFRALTKQSNGFVWITSDKGLWRYDGNYLQKYDRASAKVSGLPSNETFDVLEDRNGHIWVSHAEGISRFDEKNQIFENFIPHGVHRTDAIVSFGQMKEDNLGKIWIAGGDEVLIFDPLQKKFSRSGWYDYVKKSGLADIESRNNISHSIVRKSAEELWIMTVYGLFSVNTSSMKFVHYPHPHIKDFFAFFIADIDDDERLWILTFDQCMYAYTIATNTWQHYKCAPQAALAGPQHIKSILNYSIDSLLVLAGNQLYLLSKPTGIFKGIDFSGIEKSQFNGIKGILYEGSNLFIINENPGFEHFLSSRRAVTRIEIPLPKGVNNNIYAPLLSDHYLIGDWEKKKIFLCDSIQCKTISSGATTELGELQIAFISTEGHAYFSTSEHLYLLDIRSQSAQQITIKDRENFRHEFRNFIQDESGNIYVRERTKGMFKISIDKMSASHVLKTPGIGEYTSLYFEPSMKKIWLSSDKKGLYIIEPKDFSFKNYPFQDEAKLRTSYITDIKGDSTGNVYLLIYGKGLVHLQSNTMKATYIGEEEGLLTENVAFGVLDAKGEMWMSSISGLMSYEANGNLVHTYNEYPEISKFQHRLFSNKKGIVQNAFPRHLIQFSIPDAPANLKLGQPTLYPSAAYIDKLPVGLSNQYQLPYKTNHISLGFGKLTVDEIKNPLFEFNLNNAGWQKFDLDHQLHLYNLTSGNHQLIVRDRLEPSQLLAISVDVAFPWWQKKHTIYLAMISLLLLVWALARWQRHGLEKKMVEENNLSKRMAQLEMSALRAQMNPHFIFNCLNSINRFILMKDMDAASTYLTKFSKMIREVLEISKEEWVSIDREVNVLKLYLEMESIRFQNKFTYSIDNEHVEDLQNLFIPPLILQPIAENAIWHGFMADENQDKHHHLQITIEDKNGLIHISMDDNGIGRTKSMDARQSSHHLNNSKGMSLIKDRLDLIEQLKGLGAGLQVVDKYDDNGHAMGTLVSLHLPKIRI